MASIGRSQSIQEDSIVLRADGGYITSTADHGYLLMESTVIPVYPVYAVYDESGVTNTNLWPRILSRSGTSPIAPSIYAQGWPTPAAPSSLYETSLRGCYVKHLGMNAGDEPTISATQGSSQKYQSCWLMASPSSLLENNHLWPWSLPSLMHGSDGSIHFVPSPLIPPHCGDKGNAKEQQSFTQHQQPCKHDGRK